MTKALSLHGLGLYIYAGEDLPEGEGSDIDVNSMIDHLFLRSLLRLSEGFSVEGLFTYKTKPSKEQELMNAIKEILQRVK